MHTQDDISIILDPHIPSKIMQGVTTSVVAVQVFFLLKQQKSALSMVLDMNTFLQAGQGRLNI